MLDTLQDGNPKYTGTGCPHILEDEPAQKTCLAEQRAVAKVQEE